MNRVLEAAYRRYTEILSLTDVGLIQNRAWAYQKELVREIGKGVNGISPFLQEQPRETGRYFFDVDWLEMPDRFPTLPGTDIKVAGVGLIPKTFHNSARPVSQTQQEYGIQVNLEDGEKEIQLQVFPDDVFPDDHWKVSYRDSSFDSSQRSYLPHRDALHPPFVSTFHKARDVLIGHLEGAVISLIIDTALRTVFGEDKGFTNREELEEIAGKSIWAQGLKKKPLIPYPPGIYHEGISSLFGKIENGKQKGEELLHDQLKGIPTDKEGYVSIEFDLRDLAVKPSYGRIED